MKKIASKIQDYKLSQDEFNLIYIFEHSRSKRAQVLNNEISRNNLNLIHKVNKILN